MQLYVPHTAPAMPDCPRGNPYRGARHAVRQPQSLEAARAEVPHSVVDRLHGTRDFPLHERRLPFTKRLRKVCQALYKWVMHHSHTLAIFKSKVSEHFTAIANDLPPSDAMGRAQAAARKDMEYFYPNETRMLGTFKLMFRQLFLKEHTVAMDGSSMPNVSYSMPFSLRSSKKL